MHAREWLLRFGSNAAAAAAYFHPRRRLVPFNSARLPPRVNCFCFGVGNFREQECSSLASRSPIIADTFEIYPAHSYTHFSLIFTARAKKLGDYENKVRGVRAAPYVLTCERRALVWQNARPVVWIRAARRRYRSALLPTPAFFQTPRSGSRIYARGSERIVGGCVMKILSYSRLQFFLYARGEGGNFKLIRERYTRGVVVSF